MDVRRLPVRSFHHSGPARLDDRWRLRPYRRARPRWQDPGRLRRAGACAGTARLGALSRGWKGPTDLRRRGAELALPGLRPDGADGEAHELRALAAHVLGPSDEYRLVHPRESSETLDAGEAGASRGSLPLTDLAEGARPAFVRRRSRLDAGVRGVAFNSHVFPTRGACGDRGDGQDLRRERRP